MSKVIWKFPMGLSFAKVSVVKMPRGSQVLTVQAQIEQLVLWALVEDELAHSEPLVDRTFDIYFTGESTGTFAGKYIGTATVKGLVCHVFERMP
jgi:hypothetical protein